jgi:predicted metal-binding membrane protein
VHYVCAAKRIHVAPFTPLSELTLRLRIQQSLTYAGLITVAAVGWYALIETESAMRVMRGDGIFVELMWMMMTPGDVLRYLGATIVMWVVMMIAMMVPAVLPMLVVFRKLDRGATTEFDTAFFAFGYLSAWSLFSVVAAGLQWILHDAGWLGGDLLAMRPYAAASVLILAGAYQLTPLKESCLKKCRSPMGFFLANWRKGRRGAITMGLHHGLFCIGCCWVLMLIMFAGGAMSVLTMALLSAFILAERILPPGPWVTPIPGFALMGFGVYVAAVA